MSQQSSDPQNHTTLAKSRVRYLIPLVLLFVVPVLAYLAYDLIKPLVSPCESLFRQTQSSLGAKIELLNIKSEVSIKPEKIHELTERAQIVASNLQYCCTTLNGGKSQPEDFIQCKTSSAKFEQGLEQIVELVKETSAATEAQQSKAENNQLTEQLLSSVIEHTQLVSIEFNNQITELQKEQQYERLEGLSSADLAIKNQEAEPNDTILMPNSMPLNSWIKGEINKSREKDFYTFTTPALYRDFIQIEVQNQSTTLAPHVRTYNANKGLHSEKANRTSGGDLTFSFVVSPDAKYFLSVSEHHGGPLGKYLIRVVPLKRYDSHEPNQSILKAKNIDIAGKVEGNIMDGADHDFYRFKSDRDGRLQIFFENRSTGIAPHMELYNGNKSHMFNRSDGTIGANLILQVDVAKGQFYYLKTRDYHSQRFGQYSLLFSYVEAP